MTINKRYKKWVLVLRYYISSFVANRSAKILSSKETVDLILKTRKSIIRLGDGEFNILNGKGIHYQLYDSSLTYQLNCVIDKYISNFSETGYLLCMPGTYINPNGIKFLFKRKLISSWSYTRYIFKKKYDFPVIYGDSFLFAAGNEPLFSRIWIDSNVKKIIFVHNSNLYGIEFEKKYKIETYVIKIPERNAFEKIDKIYDEILNNVTSTEDTLVLISAGPTAKILVWRLSNINIWSIDTGHCWDDPLVII